MRFGNFVVVKYKGKIVCGQLGDCGIYLEYMGDANPIPAREVEPLFEIEKSRPFPEHITVEDFRKFFITTLTDADPTKKYYSAITFCDNCGCNWLDDGLNPIGCPYCEVVALRDDLQAENEKLRAENEAMKRCAIKYLGWLGVTHMPLDQALHDDMCNPSMCGDAALSEENKE